LKEGSATRNTLKKADSKPLRGVIKLQVNTILRLSVNCKQYCIDLKIIEFREGLFCSQEFKPSTDGNVLLCTLMIMPHRREATTLALGRYREPA
jgi:hypothetical protein